MSDEGIQHIIKGSVWVEPAGPENLTDASKAAAADHHTTLGITDIVKKGDEIIGHLSIGGVPTVLVWMDSKKANARDSWFVVRFFESILKRNKVKAFLLPCSDKSPMQPYLEQLGYKKQSASFTLYVKEL